jgi:hypothetical protein
MAMVGAANATVSGNATIALIIAAILALPPVAGAGPDANRQIADGLQLGVDAGLLDSTHGQTTIAGLASQCRGRLDTSIDTTYDSSMME